MPEDMEASPVSVSEAKRLPVKMRFEISVNGQPHGTQEAVIELVGDSLGNAPLEWSVTFPPGKALERQGDLTVRWAGEPLRAQFRASAEAIREALAEDRALEALTVLSLVVDMRAGKEFVRDSDGRAEGVIDTTFAELRWAAPEATQESA